MGKKAHKVRKSRDFETDSRHLPLKCRSIYIYMCVCVCVFFINATTVYCSQLIGILLRELV